MNKSLGYLFNFFKTSFWCSFVTWFILGMDLSNVLLFGSYVLVNCFVMCLLFVIRLELQKLNVKVWGIIAGFKGKKDDTDWEARIDKELKEK